MKIVCINLLAALALAFLTAACSTRAVLPAGIGETTVTPALRSIKTPVSKIGTSLPAVGLPSIKRLSPSSFEKDGVIFEVFAYVRESCLKFEIQITSDYQIPSPSQAKSFEPVEQLKFFSGSPGVPLILTLEGRGGGGGGGAPGGSYLLDRDFLYDVKSPLPIHGIIAMVTFHHSLGISGPVRFDVQPVARPNLYCPQLPPTTPEG